MRRAAPCVGRPGDSGMTTDTVEIRELSDSQLSDLYYADGIDLATAEREWDRRDKAARDAAKRAAERAAWLDAAHAQYQQASADCNGRLLADGASVADELSLWRGSEAWARRMASEELRNWWDDHGGRLSLAEYRRQGAMQRRADRDARDLAAMPALRPAPSPREVLAASAPRQAREPGGIARTITALGHLRRQVNAARRDLERLNGAIPR